MTRKLADIVDENANSLNLVRLTAAVCVVVSHSFLLLTGSSEAEPMALATPYTLGQHAVNVFFVVSGLTLAQSIERRPDLVRFVTARCLRIFPGLLAYGVVFAFVMGPFLTTMDLLEYLTEGHTWAYPLAVLLQFERATPPHGIFEDLPMAAMVNDPLWTIKYELFAYAGLVFLMLTGVLRHRYGALAAFVGVCIVYAAIRLVPEMLSTVPALGHLVRYGCCFLLGVLAYRYRRHVPLSAWLLALAVILVLALSETPLDEMAWYVLTGALVLVAGGRSFGQLSILARRTDISYGTYLYGWPLQQALIVAFPAISVSAHLPLSLVLALTFGWLSWHMVERPTLALKTGLSRPGKGLRNAA